MSLFFTVSPPLSSVLFSYKTTTEEAATVVPHLLFHPLFPLPSTYLSCLLLSCLYLILLFAVSFPNIFLYLTYRPHTPSPNYHQVTIPFFSLLASMHSIAQHSIADSLLWKTCWRVKKSVLLLLLLLLFIYAGIFLFLFRFSSLLA